MITSHPAIKWLMVLILAVYPLHSAAGRTIYVDAGATGANNGSSWADAYKYLQDALYSAVSGDSIWVAQGTYRPDEDTAHPGGTNDRTATFQLKNNVALYGRFPSGGGSRDPNIYQTILSGDINVPYDSNDNSYTVVMSIAAGSNTILDGFTITAGNANGSSPYDCGGGMYNSSGSPTITNCTFSGNYAYWASGGMYNDNSSPTITNCTFSENSSDYDGGGMYNCNSSPTLTNCTFSGNSADCGGGMLNYESNPTVTNCSFSGNSANYGGGMYNSDSNTYVTNCILWGNTAPNGAQICYDGIYPAVSFSDVQDGWAGTGNINADPLFVDADDNLRLLSDSPCIDAGNNSAIPTGIETDLDGRNRFADGDCNSTVIVDMGAFEFSYAYIGDFEGDCDIDLVDFAILAKAWLTGEGQTDYNPICDISSPADQKIDMFDLEVFCENWLQGSGE